MRIYQGDTGTVVLGIDIPYGFVPVLVWPTWAEYVAFVEIMNQFIEDSYRRAAMRQGLLEHIDSITAIDSLG